MEATNILGYDKQNCSHNQVDLEELNVASVFIEQYVAVGNQVEFLCLFWLEKQKKTDVFFWKDITGRHIEIYKVLLDELKLAGLVSS